MERVDKVRLRSFAASELTLARPKARKLRGEPLMGGSGSASP